MSGQIKSQPTNAVLFHRSDAADVTNNVVTSQNTNGMDFVQGFVHHSSVEQFYYQAVDVTHGEYFARRIAEIDNNSRDSTFIPIGIMGRWQDIPNILKLSDLSLGPYAWRRRVSASARSYSICGAVHSLASAAAMDGLGELLTAPLQSWDAVVCTSSSAKVMITRLLDNWSDYLGQKSGGRFKAEVQLPVIPLGIECDKYGATEETERARMSIRRGLGINDDDIAVLCFGRLNYHSKAHPMALYLALEEAVTRTGKTFHLLQVGHFPDEEIEREFRDGVRRYCPSVNGIFLGSQDKSVSNHVWFAADIFASLMDNIHEDFDSAVIDAMAAGLPVVISDWAGSRGVIRDGENGILIPTWMPLPDSGTDMAINVEVNSELELSAYAHDQYCGFVSQSTTINIAAAAEAISALAIDPALRKRLGNSGQRRARESYDWPVVINAYQELWEDQSNRRTSTVESAPTVQGQPLHPLRDDPFSLFAGYPAHTIDGDVIVSIATSEIEPGKDPDSNRRMNELRAQTMNNFASDQMLGDDDISDVLAMIEDNGPISVLALAEPLGEKIRFKLPRTLGGVLNHLSQITVAASCSMDR